MTSDKIPTPDVEPKSAPRETKGVSVRLFKDQWDAMKVQAAEDGGANYVLRVLVDGYLQSKNEPADPFANL